MTFSNTSEITFVLTSCGRFDLLKKTLLSFDLYNTAPIRHVLITEDSGSEEVYHCLPRNWSDNTTIILNKTKLGQLSSIDKAYEQVETHWVFHCEDDWEFYRPGFIEESMALLSYEAGAIQVWLRSINHDLKIHSPYLKLGPRQIFQKIPYYRICSENADWQGFSFNPGLRRISDYRIHAPYAQHGSEKRLSKLYSADARFALILENDAVLHTGFDSHVERDTDRNNKVRRKRYERIRNIVSFLIGVIVGTIIYSLR
jgi:hypothetical protein